MAKFALSEYFPIQSALNEDLDGEQLGHKENKSMDIEELEPIPISQVLDRSVCHERGEVNCFYHCWTILLDCCEGFLACSTKSVCSFFNHLCLHFWVALGRLPYSTADMQPSILKSMQTSHHLMLKGQYPQCWTLKGWIFSYVSSLLMPWRTAFSSLKPDIRLWQGWSSKNGCRRYRRLNNFIGKSVNFSSSITAITTSWILHHFLWI